MEELLQCIAVLGFFTLALWSLLLGETILAVLLMLVGLLQVVVFETCK